MTHCPECGEKLKEGAKFCADCGTKLLSGEDEHKTKYSSKSKSASNQEQKEKSHMVRTVVIVIAILVVLLVILNRPSAPQNEYQVPSGQISCSDISPRTQVDCFGGDHCSISIFGYEGVTYYALADGGYGVPVSGHVVGSGTITQGIMGNYLSLYEIERSVTVAVGPRGDNPAITNDDCPRILIRREDYHFT
ncbi:MAG TPA: zinc ribbon domain-containing protein [Candidatus Nanoarchaeia archaeon]|nr:zinc ribbon domain-containing protein [Candidatus Nanoarchaeia archaeon]